MVRKLSTGTYILAAVITVLIFSMGLLLGALVDNVRVSKLQTDTKMQELDYRSIQFQSLYLATLRDSTESCSILQTTLEKSLIDLGISLEEFSQFSEETRFNQQEYLLIGRRYMLDNLRYWLLAKETKEKCDLDVVTIIYFYSTKKCKECSDQGVILTYFKKLYEENVLIFPIDTDFAEVEPVVGILTSQYNITTYPAIVVEGKKYENVVSKEDLNIIICKAFKNETRCE